MAMSLDRVSEIPVKQKRVEGLVHGQSMPRQDIVETLVQRQHLAVLHKLMTQLSTSEIGGILGALPVDDAARLWAQIFPARQGR
jgi:magnesium transporter